MAVTKLEGGAPWKRARRIGHYGGAVDKINSPTEGAVPYAWRWFREYQAMRGDAYSSDTTSLVHCEHVALARSDAARTRAAEKVYTNSLPNTAEEKIGNWAAILAIAIGPDDTTHEVRQRCAAKYQASVGNDRNSVDVAIKTLLGDAFVAIHRQTGSDLATPPTQTFWPGINPGPASYSLGVGCWLSERAHLVVEVAQPPGMSTVDFLELVNVHLLELLQPLMPGWMTFNWALSVGADGFLLDISDMDYAGMIL